MQPYNSLVSKVWWDSPVKPSGPGTFLQDGSLITFYVPFMEMSLLQPAVSFAKLYFS